MCDSFDMACRDASNALQLNIKVNSENLLPNAQKYNVGSLRLPADPSWPKIPQRRLADDLGDIIEPPCVVTLTGTPRKSRTTVRSSNSHQSARSNITKDQVPSSFHQNIYHKTPSPSHHPIKRRPGCADPRFKRVTTVKSQMTSTDPPDRERDNPTESRSVLIIPNQTQFTTENVKKTIPEKDTDPRKVTQQEAEKPGEIRGMDSIGVQTMMSSDDFTIDDGKKHTQDVQGTIDESKKVSNVETKNCESTSGDIVDCKKERETIEKSSDGEKNLDESNTRNIIDEETLKINLSKDDNCISNLTIVPNSAVNVVQPEATCLQYCQGNPGQFFLVVENKPQVPSLGGFKNDSSPIKSCQYTTQCYNVQVPVLSYQNLPLKISTPPTPKIEISSQLPISSAVPMISTTSSSLKTPTDIRSETSKANICRIVEFSEEPNREDMEKNQSHFKPNVVSSQTIDERSTIFNDQTKRIDVSASKDKYSKKNDIVANVDSENMRKSLVTPPSKLERKHKDTKTMNYEICEKFKVSQGRQLLSDTTTTTTTDSEIYGRDKKQTRVNRCSKESSVSGSDYDDNFDKYRETDATKKRKNAIYSLTGTSREIVYSRNYENSEKEKYSSRHRKMKSEENLPRVSPIIEKHYKNISDPHITMREDTSSSIDEPPPPAPPPRIRRRENDYLRDVEKMEEKDFDRRNNDPRIVDDLDSDIPNNREFCETHRTDISNIEDSRVSPIFIFNNETTSLPVKTQELLNKSYMEYYEKLRNNNIVKSEIAAQRYVCQMAMGAPQLKKRRAEMCPEMEIIGDSKDETKGQILTMEKLSALSNIINRNLNPTLENSSDAMLTKQLYVNENMKSSSDPTAITQSAAVLRKVKTGNSADLYDSSVLSSSFANKVKRKREIPVERRLLKLKTIAFFGFMMYAMIVLLPMVYTYFMYDEYEDYEDLSYIELMLEYVVSSFREAFGGLFDAINEIFFRPVSLD